MNLSDSNKILILSALLSILSIVIFVLIRQFRIYINTYRKANIYSIRESTELLNRSTKELNDASEQIQHLKSLVEKANNNQYNDYIVIDMPNELRNTFFDILKGFEEYAQLKGYKIGLSIDSSVANKVAFKFTINQESDNITNTDVKDDINAFICKLKNGDSFDDMPYILSQQEHELVLTHLKNRVSLLHHNYTLEKNAKEYYQKMLDQLSQGKGISSTPSVFVQTGGTYTPHTVSAVNSKGIGENISFEDLSDNSQHTDITISNSFNTRKEQISKIDEIVKLIREANDNTNEIRQDLITCFSMIKDELTHQENPDKSKLHRWFSDIKGMADKLVLTHELSQAIQWVFKSFKFIG